MELLQHKNPVMLDVLVICRVDDREPIGLDISQDILRFTGAGLSVGVMFYMQSGEAGRYVNSPLLSTLVDSGIPILGYRDSALASLTIIYQPESILSRAIRGTFSTSQLAVAIDTRDVNAICREFDRYSDIVNQFGAEEFKYLAITDEAALNLKRTIPEASIIPWNREICPSSRKTDSRAIYSAKRKLKVGLSPGALGRKHSKIIEGLPIDVRGHSIQYLIQEALPTKLAPTDLSSAVFLGYPFVEPGRIEFIESLDLYLVLDVVGKGQINDVVACIERDVPTLLPASLKKYFGSDAAYYSDSIFDNDLWSAMNRSDKTPGSIGPERNVFSIWADLWSDSTTPGTPTPQGQTGEKTITRIPVQDVDSNPFENVSTAAQKGKLRACFVTSNGAGMGHLTRLLAVARRLDSDFESSFISMSQACGVVESYGMKFEYIPSKGDLGVSGPEWNDYFNTKFIEALDRIKPHVVIFDGTWPYQGVAKAVSTYDAKFVWMRRGMWRETTKPTSLIRNTNFDLVIAPGDVASKYDRGPTSYTKDAKDVEPIVVMSRDELLSRERARRELGYDLEDRIVLITLGAGNINSIDDDVQSVVDAVEKLDHEWKIVITSPIISHGSSSMNNLHTISVYPLAKYARAFDFVVSATGYNSYHEWIAYGIPALWVPNRNTITDDQVGRAVFAHDIGIGYCAGDESDMSIEDAISRLASDDLRSEMVKKIESVSFRNGAIEAAQLITELVRGGVV